MGLASSSATPESDHRRQDPTLVIRFGGVGSCHFSADARMEVSRTVLRVTYLSQGGLDGTTGRRITLFGFAAKTLFFLFPLSRA